VPPPGSTISLSNEAH
jgi:hypothetical protein